MDEASALFGHLNALLLYASDDQLFSKLKSWEVVSEATSHLLSESKNLDPINLNRATKRLNDSIVSLILKIDPSASFTSGALLIPTKLRKDLLSLSALTPNFIRLLLDEVKRIEYSEKDLITHFRVGSERQLYNFDFDFESADINIFWALENLQIANGAMYKMSISQSLEQLEFWRDAAPDNLSKIINFFDPEIEFLVSGSDSAVLSKILKNLDTTSPQDVSAPYDRLIKQEIRYLYLHSDILENDDRAILAGMPQPWFDYAMKSESKIEELLLYQNLEKGNNDFQAKFFQIAESVTSVKDLCGNIRTDTCSKLVREIDIELIFERE